MDEKFLYYIWKHQYFDKKNLQTEENINLNIINPGIHNQHAGPDFLHATIILNDITWHGHIELHIHAEDWKRHQHHLNPAYDNVILHIVWHKTQYISIRSDQTTIPTLTLQDKVSVGLVDQYYQLQHNPSPILCALYLPTIHTIHKTFMLNKCLTHRLMQKNQFVHKLLSHNKGDWDATAYQLLAHNMGFQANSTPFLALSQALPWPIIYKNADCLLSIEALLLGTAGFLSSVKADDQKKNYIQNLTKKYRYILYKYKTEMKEINIVQWKFFRLRPPNFPTIRIAQFAQILHLYPRLFDLLTTTFYKKFYKLLAVKQSTYWQNHYHIDKATAHPIAGIGKISIENIVINTVVPLLVAYGKFQDHTSYINDAVAILEQLPPEDNSITNHWKKVGVKPQSAFDSQALITLFNDFCKKKKCLSCTVGSKILHKKINCSSS